MALFPYKGGKSTSRTLKRLGPKVAAGGVGTLGWPGAPVPRGMPYKSGTAWDVALLGYQASSRRDERNPDRRMNRLTNGAALWLGRKASFLHCIWPPMAPKLSLFLLSKMSSSFGRRYCDLPA